MAGLTTREKGLMLKAFEEGVWEALSKMDYPDVVVDVEKEFNGWLSNSIADNGATVESILDAEH